MPFVLSVAVAEESACLSCHAVLPGCVAPPACLQVISVEPPNFVELEVVDAPPGVKGNTASGECSTAGLNARHTQHAVGDADAMLSGRSVCTVTHNIPLLVYSQQNKGCLYVQWLWPIAV